jgi:acid phosphatase type 7
MKKIIILFIALFNFTYAQNPKSPSRIILNLTAKPATGMAVTWRTLNEVRKPAVQYSVEKEWIDFAKSASSIEAKEEKLNIDASTADYHYSAVMENLKPGTRYVYRVGGDSAWSEWNQFTTAKNENEPFNFVFFGDPQAGFRDFLPRIFRRALLTAPDAKFWLFTGDLTDRPKDENQWNDLFYSLDFIPRIIPGVMVPGNHEYMAISKSQPNTRGLTKYWRPHFTLPENGADSLNETSYYFDYQGVRFIMLNGQAKRPEQAKWMDKILAENKNKWIVVAVHQPAFSMGADRDEKDIHDNFVPLFDKYSVDLVLTGHDHVYSRSYKLRDGIKVKDDEKGTIYAVSVSGTKQYPLTLKYKDLMVKYTEKIQLFQVISIDNNKLTYKSCTADGKIFDEFELKK